DALDRVMLRSRAEAQAVDLREDVPHPVCPFLAALHFRQCSLEIVFLSFHEAPQIVRVARARSLNWIAHTRFASGTAATANPLPLPPAQGFFSVVEDQGTWHSPATPARPETSSVFP